MKEIHLDLSSSPFDLDRTLECGQVFRWERRGKWWYGIIGNQVVKVRQIGMTLSFQTNTDGRDIQFVQDYFRLDDDLTSILKSINRDSLMNMISQKYYGMRVIRQDPWECLISFVCATNTNISAIRGMLFNLCRRYGDEVDFEGERYYTFPTPSALTKASLCDLKACGLGRRSAFVATTAQRISSGAVSLEEVNGYEYTRAKEKLLCKSYGHKVLPGVGPKVADCVLLFSMDKLEAFPIDIWIQRVVIGFYAHLFEDRFTEKLRENMSHKKSLGFFEYRRIAEVMRNYFGEYAGYAQEYLYTYVRSR